MKRLNGNRFCFCVATPEWGEWATSEDCQECDGLGYIQFRLP